MEILIPSFMTLHFFGFILWTGSALVQYVYLADIVDRGTLEAKHFAMDVIGRLNKTFLNVGLGLVVLTGAGMIYFHGMDWFRSHAFVSAKLILGLIAAAFSHIGWAKYKKAYALLEKNPAEIDAAPFRGLMKSWKMFLVATIILLGVTLITAIFKFGS